MKLFNKDIRYWLRVIHRDIGFLTIGLCMVYGISGIFLNHIRQSSKEHSTKYYKVFIGKGFDERQIENKWKSVSNLNNMPRLNNVRRIDSVKYRLMLRHGIGIYDTQKGYINYKVYKTNEFVYWINRLHRNRVNGWSIVGDVFCIMLIFLAISGMFMTKGKNGFAGRGKWFFIIGIVIPIIYVLLNL